MSGVWERRDEQTIRNELGREFACSENIDIQIGRVLENLKLWVSWKTPISCTQPTMESQSADMDCKGNKTYINTLGAFRLL